MWKFLLAVTIAGVAAENSQTTCSKTQQKFCPAGASKNEAGQNLGNTCQNDCTGCTGFTGQIQSFVPLSRHRRYLPCLKTGTPPSQEVCSYFGALLVFCPASASAQQNTCQNDCRGCTGFTVDGNTCQADGTLPSQTTCRKNEQKFCPASASAQQSTCQDACTGCTGFTVDGNTCQATGTAPSETSCHNNEQKFVGNKCQSCAAIDAAKSKWLQSSTSCVACLGTVQGYAAGCSGTDVCSLKTPNTCVVVGSSDGTCAAIDAAKPKWLASGGGSCVACLASSDCAGNGGTDVCSKTTNTCVVVGSSDATCAAIDAAKSKWLQSSTSCVACIIPASPDDAGCFVTGCTGKVCGQTIGQNDAEGGKALFLLTQPKTGTVCSKGTPNTCVAPAKDDTSCAAIDPAFPLSSLFVVTWTQNNADLVACVAIPKDDATCAYYNGPANGGMGEYDAGTGTWSTVDKKCVQSPIDDATCAAFDAAKPKWTTPKYCGDGSPPITDGAKMCGTGTTYDKTKKKCETMLPTDIELAKMCGAGTTYDKAKKKCEMASPLVTCGDGTTLTANKCGITSPTDDALGKLCGEGTTFDKAKKKCITDPTSRCTTNAAAAKESAGSRTATLATSVITATMLVLVVIPLH